MPMPIIRLESIGTLAVIITTPAETHEATPFILMVATIVLADIQVRPSAGVSILLVLLLNFPIAVKVMLGIELPIETMEARIDTDAVEGLTAILINRGWSLPQPRRTAARNTTEAKLRYLMLHL